MKEAEKLRDKALTLKNLRILREGWSKQDFDPIMIQFGGLEKKAVKVNIDQVNECGTNCCLLGKAPEFEGLEVVEKDFVRSGTYFEKEFSYHLYSERLFPYLDNPIHNPDYLYTKWSFVFGSRWANDREKALVRIDYMLNNDLVLLTSICGVISGRT